MTLNPLEMESRFPSIPESADFDRIWTYLKPGIDYIMTKPEAGLSYLDYTNLYTAVYNYSMPRRIRSRLNGKDRDTDNMPGSKLYHKLDEYFIQHLRPMVEKSESLQDAHLLHYYTSEWDRYMAGANYLSRLFSCLNRLWVKRERDEGRKYVYPIYALALAQWKTYFFAQIQNDNAKLTGALLHVITLERDGKPVYQDLVKKVINSFVSLGFDNSNLNKECLNVYQDQFEDTFLQVTEDYYKTESEAFLAENSVSEYLKKVEKYLRDEEKRAERYLHRSTRENHISKCENALIRAQSSLIQESFQSLLDSGKDEDLQRMYTLLSRIPDGLGPIREKFEAYNKDAIKRSDTAIAALKENTQVR